MIFSTERGGGYEAVLERLLPNVYNLVEPNFHQDTVARRIIHMQSITPMIIVMACSDVE